MLAVSVGSWAVIFGRSGNEVVGFTLRLVYRTIIRRMSAWLNLELRLIQTVMALSLGGAASDLLPIGHVLRWNTVDIS